MTVLHMTGKQYYICCSSSDTQLLIDCCMPIPCCCSQTCAISQHLPLLERGHCLFFPKPNTVFFFSFLLSLGNNRSPGYHGIPSNCGQTCVSGKPLQDVTRQAPQTEADNSMCNISILQLYTDENLKTTERRQKRTGQVANMISRVQTT